MFTVLTIATIKPYLLFMPMTAVNALETYHMWALQQTAESASKLRGDGTLWAQLVILITTLATLGYQVYTRHADWKEKERQRAWDLEDRRLAREEQNQRAEAAKHEVKREVRQSAAQVTAAVEENTQLTAHAATAANAAEVKARAAEHRLGEVLAMFENGGTLNGGSNGSSGGSEDATRATTPRDPPSVHDDNRNGRKGEP